MVGWHHQLNGHESEQTLGDSEQGTVPQLKGSQRIRHHRATEQQQQESPRWGQKRGDLGPESGEPYSHHPVDPAPWCCSVAQLCPTLCDSMDCSMPGFVSFNMSQSLLKLMSIESVMPSNHIIPCHPLLLLPSIFRSVVLPPNYSHPLPHPQSILLSLKEQMTS